MPPSAYNRSQEDPPPGCGPLLSLQDLHAETRDVSIMKILLVGGARPNFMKIAPIIKELKAQSDEKYGVFIGAYRPAL